MWFCVLFLIHALWNVSQPNGIECTTIVAALGACVDERAFLCFISDAHAIERVTGK